MSWIETVPAGRTAWLPRPGRHEALQVVRPQADAKTFLAAALTDIARGEWRDPRGAVPFREWADKWFAARVVRRTTQAANLGRYRTHLLPAFGDAEFKDLTPLPIKTFVADVWDPQPATVRHAHVLLSTILSDAVAEGLLLTNPRRFSRLPRAARYEAGYLSPAGSSASSTRSTGVPRPRHHRRRHRLALGRPRRAQAPARGPAPPGTSKRRRR